MVISDKPNDINNEGNQFVWVPVENFDEFKRYDFENDKELSNTYSEEFGDGIRNETEAEKMYKSVKENKGFYIGRYEAGKDEIGNAISKKNVKLYNDIKFSNSLEDETGGAVEKARNFSLLIKNENITSTLVYGVQWDAIMRWLYNGNIDEKTLLKNSIENGNYSGKVNETTGSDEKYQIKRIYDLAGNVWEMTMETNSEIYKVSRGGDFGNDGHTYPCSSRSQGAVDGKAIFKGFRIALFINT